MLILGVFLGCSFSNSFLSLEIFLLTTLGKTPFFFEACLISSDSISSEDTATNSLASFCFLFFASFGLGLAGSPNGPTYCLGGSVVTRTILGVAWATFFAYLSSFLFFFFLFFFSLGLEDYNLLFYFCPIMTLTN